MTMALIHFTCACQSSGNTTSQKHKSAQLELIIHALSRVRDTCDLRQSGFSSKSEEQLRPDLLHTVASQEAHKAGKPSIGSNGLDKPLKHPRIGHLTVCIVAEDDGKGNTGPSGLGKKLKNIAEKYPVLITVYSLYIWTFGIKSGATIALQLKWDDIIAATHRSDEKPESGACRSVDHKHKGMRLAIVLDEDESDWMRDGLSALK